VTTVEKIVSASFASPSALCVARHRMAPTAVSESTAYGREAARVTAPVSAAFQGTSVSIATLSMRETTPVTALVAQAKATALLPISDVAVVNGFGGLAGIRNWSPPV
jgi:hypothetical protein